MKHEWNTITRTLVSDMDIIAQDIRDLEKMRTRVLASLCVIRYLVYKIVFTLLGATIGLVKFLYYLLIKR